MRNLKRFLALALAMLMLCGMFVFPTSAAEEGDYTEAAQRLATIGILKGDGAGNLMLQQAVRRWQTALFFVQILTGVTEADKLNAEKTSKNFTDVTDYGYAIDVAYGLNIVRGRGDGTYGYNDYITYQDMLVMAVRALGYETDSMMYPHGHILAAEKLGLTKNLEKGMSFTAPLTRGETAQIMWNTLITQIAYVDPLSNEIVYPNEFGFLDTILENGDQRENFLTRSGFVHTTATGIITGFKAAKLSSNVDIVTVDFGDEVMELNAAHIGIDETTRKADYLGLPITLYIDCDYEEFVNHYQTYADENDPTIVFTDFTILKNVTNIGSEGNIKYVEETDTTAEYFVLDGKKYSADKYVFDIRVLDREDGWVPNEYLIKENFLYDTDKKKYTGLNSYGEVDYKVFTEEIGNIKVNILTILYTPYEFGRYAARSIVYDAANTKMNVVTIADYVHDITGYSNFDGNGTKFVERTLGENSMEIAEGIVSVPKEYGELSVTVTLEGLEAANNEFVFYHYNELDNVLDIVYNCGAATKGKITSFNAKQNTLKINGKEYEFGFTGAYDAFDTYYEDEKALIRTKYLEDLEAGLNNAYYVVENGNVVYISDCYNHKDAQHEYLVVSTKPATMAKLLDIEEDKYLDMVSDTFGLYLEKNTVKAAVLDTTTGEWSLQPISKVDMGTYDRMKDEYSITADLATHFAGYMISGTGYPKLTELSGAADILNKGIVKLRGQDKNGYIVAEIISGADKTDNYIDYGTTTAGLYFSDVSAATNKIKATKDTAVSSSRKTMKDESVIVAIDSDGNVGVRTGIQKEINSIKNQAGRFYTATNTLIVFQLYETYDVAAWEKALSAEENYYIATKNSSVEYEKLEDETYLVTANNLFDLKELTTATVVTEVVTDLSDSKLVSDFEIGKVIYMNEAGKMSVLDIDYDVALVAASNILVEKDDEKYAIGDVDSLEFVNHESISIDLENGVQLDKADAVNYIDILVSTIDLTSYKNGEYNIEKMAYNEEFETYVAGTTPAYLKGVLSTRLNGATDEKVYSYSLIGMDGTASVSSPTAGRLNQYIIETLGEELLIAETGDDYFDNAASVTLDLAIAGRFDEKEGVVSLYVLKILKDYVTP